MKVKMKRLQALILALIMMVTCVGVIPIKARASAEVITGQLSSGPNNTYRIADGVVSLDLFGAQWALIDTNLVDSMVTTINNSGVTKLRLTVQGELELLEAVGAVMSELDNINEIEFASVNTNSPFNWDFSDMESLVKVHTYSGMPIDCLPSYDNKIWHNSNYSSFIEQADYYLIEDSVTAAREIELIEGAKGYLDEDKLVVFVCADNTVFIDGAITSATNINVTSPDSDSALLKTYIDECNPLSLNINSFVEYGCEQKLGDITSMFLGRANSFKELQCEQFTVEQLSLFNLSEFINLERVFLPVGFDISVFDEISDLWVSSDCMDMVHSYFWMDSSYNDSVVCEPVSHLTEQRTMYYAVKGPFKVSYSEIECFDSINGYVPEEYNYSSVADGSMAWLVPTKEGYTCNALQLEFTNTVQDNYKYDMQLKDIQDGMFYIPENAERAWGDLTVIPVWAPNEYTIYFNAGKGECNIESKTVIYTSAIGELPTPTRDGYKFIGWYNGATQITEETVYSITDNSTVEAKWELDTENKFVLGTEDEKTTYWQYSDGVMIITGDSVDDYDVEENEAFLEALALTDSVVFELDNTTIASLGSLYAAFKYNVEDNQMWVESDRCVAINEDLYGYKRGDVFYKVEAPFDVSYELYGSNLANAPTTHDSKSSILLSRPTRTGYDYSGMYYEEIHPVTGEITNTSSVMVGTPNLPSGVIGHLVMHAKWEPKEYEVYLDANGGSVSTGTVEIKYDSNYSLPTPNKAGYTFVGWYNNDKLFDSTGIYKEDSNLELVAAWTASTFKIFLDANSGIIDREFVSAIYGKEFELPIPDKEGYEFLGWYKGTKLIELTDIYEWVENINLVAKWRAEKYLITFNANKGRCDVDSKEVYFDSVFGELPVPTRQGYEFLGWYTAIVGGSKIETTTVLKTAKDMELFARWEDVPPRIMFDCDGGTVDKDYVDLTDHYDWSNLPTPEKKGHTFLGWYYEGTPIEKVDVTTIDGDIVLIAVWSVNEYRINFNTNGGSTVAPIDVTYNASIGILPRPSKEGYKFVGWLLDNQLIQDNTLYTWTKDIKLTAKWESKTYTIKLDANGGKCSVKERVFSHGDTVGELPIASRKNYWFDGWYTKKVGGEFIQTFTKAESLGNTTIYAHWTKVKVKKSSITKLESSKKKQLVVKYKKVSGAQGYEIAVSTSKKFKKSVTKTYTVKSKLSKTIKKLKSKKVYYVRVRAYKIDSTGKKVYGSWCKVKKVKIK